MSSKMAVLVVFSFAFCFLVVQATFAEQDDEFLGRDQVKRDEVELIRHLLERLREVETKRASICGTVMMKGGASTFYAIGDALGEVRFQKNKLLIQFDNEAGTRLVDHRPAGEITAEQLAAQKPFESDEFQLKGKTYKLIVGRVGTDNETFCIEEQ